MTNAQLIELIASECGFIVDETSFDDASTTNQRHIIRRLSSNPAYRTEYTTMLIIGDIIKVVIDETNMNFDMKDPNSLDSLKEKLCRGKLFQSFASLDIPVGRHLCVK